MKSLRQFSELRWLVVLAGVAAFAPTSLGQTEKPLKETSKSDPPCPVISISCPSSFKDGEAITANAIVKSENLPGSPTYNWTIHGGTIIQGQGTPAINFKVSAGGDSYVVSLQVGGLKSGCPASASCSLIIDRPPPSTKSDSYGILPIKKEKARLDNFAAVLKDQPGAMGYILSYGSRGGSARAARDAGDRAKAYLVKEQRIHAERIVTIEGGFKEKLTVDLWVVPTGATPPKPEPTVDTGAVKRIK